MYEHNLPLKRAEERSKIIQSVYPATEDNKKWVSKA